MKAIGLLTLVSLVTGLKHRRDPEDFWIEIPQFKISVNDPHEQWGHETQRVGNEDWLDKHVREVAKIKASVPPPLARLNRWAIWDS